MGISFTVPTGMFSRLYYNAALNVLARLDAADISRYTPYREVRRILLARSFGATERQGLELGAQARQPSADKSMSSFEQLLWSSSVSMKKPPRLAAAIEGGRNFA